MRTGIFFFLKVWSIVPFKERLEKENKLREYNSETMRVRKYIYMTLWTLEIKCHSTFLFLVCVGLIRVKYVHRVANGGALPTPLYLATHPIFENHNTIIAVILIV